MHLLCNLYPILVTSTTVPGSTSLFSWWKSNYIGLCCHCHISYCNNNETERTFWNSASCIFGSNLVFNGSMVSSPCRLNVCCSEFFVRTKPSYKFFKCGFLSLIWSFGTATVACPRVSATSNKSLQNDWIPNILASWICFVKRWRTFSPSANARLYLSCNYTINWWILIAMCAIDCIHLPVVRRSFLLAI